MNYSMQAQDEVAYYLQKQAANRSLKASYSAYTRIEEAMAGLSKVGHD